jgi:centrosomal protein CEP104
MVNMDARCEFCLTVNPNFANQDNDELDMHYISSCLMLTTCKGCQKIVEISKIAEHMSNECEVRDKFEQCSRCLIIFESGSHYESHVQLV